MITAHSTPATGFPVQSKALPKYASFEDALAAMQQDAGEVRKRHCRPSVIPAAHEQPSKGQEPALLALKGTMLTSEVAEIIGHRDAAGFLSGLCAKGFVERAGWDGNTVKWRTTRKGRKWVERNGGSGK